MASLRYDSVRFDAIQRTPQGGIRATARLTRAGVFPYRRADGSTTRELRHPDDVMAADSLATLRGAPLTIGHPPGVTSANWRDLVVGHVGDDVRAEGRFVAATIYVQDAETCDRVESGELVELSCGYTVDMAEEIGEFDGEHYDSRQINQRYNHVAIGGRNWGRAGNDVRIHLDSADNAYTEGMAEQRIDDNSDVKARLDAVEKERDKVAGERDALRSDNDALRLQVTQLKADKIVLSDRSQKLVDPSDVSKLVARRVQLEYSARRILGERVTFDGKSDRDVIVAALSTSDVAFKAEGRSDDYLQARFDAAVESATKADTAVASLAVATNPAAVAPVAAAPSRLDEALKKVAAETAELAKAGPPACATFRR